MLARYVNRISCRCLIYFPTISVMSLKRSRPLFLAPGLGRILCSHCYLLLPEGLSREDSGGSHDTTGARIFITRRLWPGPFYPSFECIRTISYST